MFIKLVMHSRKTVRKPISNVPHLLLELKLPARGLLKSLSPPGEGKVRFMLKFNFSQGHEGKVSDSVSDIHLSASEGENGIQCFGREAHCGLYEVHYKL